MQTKCTCMFPQYPLGTNMLMKAVPAEECILGKHAIYSFRFTVVNDMLSESNKVQKFSQLGVHYLERSSDLISH